jgi:DNA-binding MarR family transcriptional regulator
MSEVLRLLEDRGYVKRIAEPGNGRVIRTEVTQRGRRALERCDLAVDAVEREMLADFTAADVTELRDALLRCGRALEPVRERSLS